MRFSLVGLTCINELRLLSAHTHCVLRTFRSLTRTNLTMRFLLAVKLALCGDHYIFTSCHCYHGEERESSVYTTSSAAISLRCLHIFGVAMETSRMSMTALCVRHAGRGDVMRSPPPPPPTTVAFTLLCQRLLTSASLINFAKLKATRARRHVPQQLHEVPQSRNIPALSVCGI